MRLDGTEAAESDVPILRTDRSFFVSAWAKLDDTDGDRVVASQTGQTRSGFYLRYHAASDRWQFAMASDDAAQVTWHAADSQTAPQTDR